jgi:hypothetical protein
VNEHNHDACVSQYLCLGHSQARNFLPYWSIQRCYWVLHELLHLSLVTLGVLSDAHGTRLVQCSLNPYYAGDTSWILEIPSKEEHFLPVNDQDKGIVICTCYTNIACLCNDITDLFIDGTLYKVLSGGKKGNPKNLESHFPISEVLILYSMLRPTFWICLHQAWPKWNRQHSYRIKTSEIGKWLSRFFGLPFLPPDQVAVAFAEDKMSDAPDSDKCSAL